MPDERPHLLVFTGRVTSENGVPECLRDRFEVEVVDNMNDALSALRRETFHAVFADVGDFLPLERAMVGEKSSLVLNTIGEGVLIVDQDGLERLDTCVYGKGDFLYFRLALELKAVPACVIDVTDS